MKPNFVAKKSAYSVIRWWKLLVFLPLLWIPLFAQMIKAKSHKVEFYDDYAVEKKGVFRKETNTYVVPGIYTVTTEQSFCGRLGNFGNVKVGVIGKPLDVDLTYVKRPKKLKAYLDTKIMDPKRLRIVMGTDKLNF
jgi:hypothetical protein